MKVIINATLALSAALLAACGGGSGGGGGFGAVGIGASGAPIASDGSALAADDATVAAADGGTFDPVTGITRPPNGAGASSATNPSNPANSPTLANPSNPGAGNVKAPTTAASPASPAARPVAAAAPALPPADPAPSGPASAGALDANSYRATAASMGKPAGIAYRYGPSAGEYGSSGNGGLPTWFKRNDNAFVSDRNGGQRACIPGNCGTWQLGGPYVTAGGDYSSNLAHVAFTPDDPAARVGVSDLTVLSVSNQVISQKPELSWTLYEGGLDEINAVDYKKAGKDASNPVALAHCLGRPGWCVNSLMVFQSGLIATAGNNTARNQATAQLAANKVPTGIALSNSSEFALITVWDTAALRGEIAVVALAGMCDGCTPNKPDNGGQSWWGEWRGNYPGLPNLGNVAFMKVLGYVPLPDNMKAPTEISVTTGVDRFAYLPAGVPGYENPSTLTLNSQGNRDSFKAGGRNYGKYAHQGVAVVISKTEKTVAFVDLQPLFKYYEDMYFNGGYGTTTNVGLSGGQWPLTFGEASRQMPVVVKTVAMAGAPTAVQSTPWGSTKRAWIATQEGQLHIFDLGDYRSAASIREVASVAVGRNPTNIALVKPKAGDAIYPDTTKEVIVTSRGDRKLDWVRMAGDGNSGSVVRTLKDARMVDPIAAQDNDNHATESYLVAVADYGGKALHNYRYGPVITHGYSNSACAGGCGMGTSGKDPFEYGGAFDLPGKAFQVTSMNIP